MKEISMERVNEARNEILETIKNHQLTHEQKVSKMAVLADSLMEVLEYPEGLKELMSNDPEEKVICDLGEGHAPVRPRYIIPDYQAFLEHGSEFLGLTPPRDIWEATNALLIFYKHVPSVTNYPVYVGNLGELLEPFVKDEEEAKKAIRLFLIHMDRTILDSFCHANIGPTETKAGRIILELEQELEQAVPNLTLKYDKDITPDSFAELAAKTALKSAKPSFANHQMFKNELGDDYVIASCYNGLKLGGGSYTLCRMLLGNLAKKAHNKKEFFEDVLPQALEIMALYMDERIRFIVEESGFFESNFLAKEGFIKRERFTAMYGIVGLADCVNNLLEKENIEGRFGHSKLADDLGVEIIQAIDSFVKNHNNPYCEITGGHFLLHAQVGIDSDVDSTPGCRIPIGEEPENFAEHLLHCGKFHPYFPSGIGDIFPIEVTVEKNPAYLIDVVKGAFEKGVRYLSFYSSNSDVVRITGYLVKRSEMEKLKNGENVLLDTTKLGLDSVKNSHVLERKVR
ncbi:YjjI family glycine radical enzyme [Velocimicrobium porci]|uniref:YjjI family glycine radical enzyme n=1 Tax=Velocimicrobium porci TaxID=2606634 RepID=A0A6L5XY47_9FIRM|nr:YjjI family glycine radical enzyme [Velocimicrobium porci]MSS62873.1 YjjI family glycine radical enzyme [Velocimicrobium porci]